jgi:hypothetical protein
MVLSRPVSSPRRRRPTSVAAPLTYFPRTAIGPLDPPNIVPGSTTASELRHQETSSDSLQTYWPTSVVRRASAPWLAAGDNSFSCRACRTPAGVRTKPKARRFVVWPPPDTDLPHLMNVMHECLGQKQKIRTVGRHLAACKRVGPKGTAPLHPHTLTAGKAGMLRNSPENR